MKTNISPKAMATCLLLLTALASSRLEAQTVPPLINYQGRLVNSNNLPLPTGDYELRFSLWDAATGGTQVWGPQLFNGSNGPGLGPKVSVVQGWFNVMLGPVDTNSAAIANAFTASNRFVEVQVGAGPALAPRQQILSTPYALKAERAAVADSIAWQVVTSTAQQAVPNVGYLANNLAQVTITLPPTPASGDVIRAASMGTGGWKIAQNPAQSILTKNIGGVAGLVWTPRESPRAWMAVASSADGNKLVAVVFQGQIYTSTDGGVTWVSRETSRKWRAVASSADGSKLVAVVFYGGQIFTSTDGGVTWIARENSRDWSCVASSADGSKLVALAWNGQIYTSSDSGITWTARESPRTWCRVASSTDGNKLVATVYQGQIYTSTNAGVTWIAHESSRAWQGVASSADGSKLVAGVWNGQIYTSSDSGVNWTARNTESLTWDWLASSADGNKLLASNYQRQLYTSSDAGVTWVARANTRTWGGVASSADGGKLFAVETGGYICTSVPMTTPGPAGCLNGDEDASLELQYANNGQWRILGHQGTITSQ